MIAFVNKVNEKMEKNDKKLKKLNQDIQKIKTEITELLRQIELEKESPMVLVKIDGKTCWRSGEIDESTFEETIRSILGSEKGKDDKKIYKPLFLTLKSLLQNGHQDIIIELLKEFKKNVVILKEEQLDSLNSDINKLKEDIRVKE